VISRRRARWALFAIIGAVLQTACAGDDTAQDAPERGSPLVIGAPTPAYTAITLAGGEVRLGAGADTLTLVNVWATWCASCREEMQDLERIHRDYRGRGLRVVAISVDAGSERLVRRIAEAEGLSFTVVHDQAARIQSVFQVMGVPANYLIGRDGRLIWQHTGGIHGATGPARSAIERTLVP
jgi:cytochrome c biogenesis protein CcmG, thiol:disulfide interchange protein DsbE